jgi:serine/threonine protein phosphatase PrpC
MGAKSSKAEDASMLEGAKDEGSDPSLMQLTRIEELGSQGTVVSSDGTVAMVHESTTPPNYYRSKYALSGGINMDRGGFGRHADGTNVAVVFDGVSAGGKRNAYAAQAFARSTLSQLVSHKCAFAAQVTSSAGQPGSTLLPPGVARTAPVLELFSAALDQANNPGEVDPSYEAEGGAATGAIVTFQQREIEGGEPQLLLIGAALGDAAVIAVEPSSEAGTVLLARQLNQVERIGGRAADSGGQLNMCMGISGVVRAFAQPIHMKTLVLVCTDGLTDNLPTEEHEAAVLLPWLMRCALLDNPVPGPGLAPAVAEKNGEARDSVSMPGAEAVMQALREAYTDAGRVIEPEPEPEPELRSSEQGSRFEEVRDEPRVVGQRLRHYVEWVTRRLYASEQAYFGEEARYHAMVRQRLAAEAASYENGEEPDDVAMTSHKQALLEQEIAASQARLQELLDKQRAGPRVGPGKTDDALMVVMRPFGEDVLHGSTSHGSCRERH